MPHRRRGDCGDRRRIADAPAGRRHADGPPDGGGHRQADLSALSARRGSRLLQEARRQCRAQHRARRRRRRRGRGRVRPGGNGRGMVCPRDPVPDGRQERYRYRPAGQRPGRAHHVRQGFQRGVAGGLEGQGGRRDRHRLGHRRSRALCLGPQRPDHAGLHPQSPPTPARP